MSVSVLYIETHENSSDEYFSCIVFEIIESQKKYFIYKIIIIYKIFIKLY